MLAFVHLFSVKAAEIRVIRYDTRWYFYVRSKNCVFCCIMLLPFVVNKAHQKLTDERAS